MAEETQEPEESRSAARAKPRRAVGGRAKPSSAAAARRPARGRRRALLVAINEYDAFNWLPSCIADADAFADVLDDYDGFEVTKLYDADADLASVRTALNELFADASPDDRLVFFFSGHGTTVDNDGVVEECLVLHGKDDFLLDDEIVQAASDVPPGVLTMVIDSCFSGGTDKSLLAPVRKGFKVIDRGRVKAWTRPTAKRVEEHAEEQKAAKAVKRFGEAVIKVSNPLDVSVFGPVIGFAAYPESKGLIPAPPSDEVRQTAITGVLLAACLEEEKASASATGTEGLSVFTFALVDSLRRLGPMASASSLVAATQQKVRSIGGAQTPLLKANPEAAGHRTFITSEPTAPFARAGDDFDPTSTETLQRLLSGGHDMNPLLLTLLLSGAQKSGGAQQKLDPATITAAAAAITAIGSLFKGEQKALPGLFPSPIINPLILLAAAGGPGGQKGIVDLLPTLVPLLLKSDQGDGGQKGLLDVLPVVLPLLLKGGQGEGGGQKGLLDVLPVVLPLLLKSGQGGGDKGLGDLVPLILPLLKSGGGEEKVDPATITAAAAVITALGGLFK